MSIRFRRAIESRIPVWPDEWAEEAGIALACVFLAAVLLYAGVMWWVAIPVALFFEGLHIWNLN
jgi:hypothetical protein